MLLQPNTSQHKSYQDYLGSFVMFVKVSSFVAFLFFVNFVATHKSYVRDVANLM